MEKCFAEKYKLPLVLTFLACLLLILVSQRDSLLTLSNKWQQLPKMEPILNQTKVPISPQSLSNKTVLIYNRVQKTASDTMRHLFHQIGHGSKAEKIEFWNKPLNETQLQSLCHYFDEFAIGVQRERERTKDTLDPTVISGHFFHVDLLETCGFDAADVERVVWFNQLRDPVERFISLYYYHRSAEHIWYAQKLRREGFDPFIPTEVRF